MQTITRIEVQKKIAGPQTVKIIETLPTKNFRKFHLPGAINVPVDDERFEEKMQQAVPEKSTPVIVYCLNRDCSASPRAGRRLEELGYEEVYDYEAGKEDWRDAGNPIES